MTLVAKSATSFGIVAAVTLPPIPLHARENMIEAELLRLTNSHRATLSGVSATQLGPNSTLDGIAWWKASDCADGPDMQHAYLAHDQTETSAGWPNTTIGQRFAAGGWPASYAWGENIAYGVQTAAEILAAFLSDLGHRQNVEGPWNVCGFAVVRASNGLLFAVQDFGYIPGTQPPVDPPPVVPPINVGSKWQRHSTGVTGTVTALSGTAVIWRGKGQPVTRTPRQFRAQFTHVSG